MNTYWLRRQMAGEVEVVKPPVARKTGTDKPRKSQTAERGK